MIKNNIKTYFVMSVLILSASGMMQNNAFAATAPSLGTAESFAVLAGSAVTCTGGGIAGDVGVYPGTAITLTGCPVDGTSHSGDSIAEDAQEDALAAYNDLLGQTCDYTLSSTPVTQTLTPGVYCSTAGVTMTGVTLTLDAQGDPNAVFIFQIGAALTMTGSEILLVNGTQASNVFWQVTSAATLTDTTFEGTLIAKDGAITATDTTANCGLFALNFAVTTTNSVITECEGDSGTIDPQPVDLPLTNQGRMTGGGSVFDSDNRITHGFTLQCDVTNGPNNLEVNWGKGNKFHLDTLTSVICANDPAIDPKPPAVGFDTYVGTGTGSLNGVSGATATWIFTDAGEPGKKDNATIVITDGSGIVLTVSGNLHNGNQQAHK